MLREIDNFFLLKEEPVRSCLLYLRAYLLAYDKNITESWKYKMPFYSYQGKMFCYLWFHRKKQLPYIGIVEGKKINHPELLMESRSRMKILLLNPKEDVPLQTLDTLFQMALKLYV